MLKPRPASPGAPSPRACPAAPALKYLPLDNTTLAADGAFAGYASLFNVPDMGNDIIAPGAFAESLARRGPRGIKLLFQHDASQPIGVWKTLREDARGLYAEGQLSVDNSQARDILALLRSGAIDGLSIGFRTTTANRAGKSGPRRLTKIDLWEISVVTFPMLQGARITSVKAQPRARIPTANQPLATAIQSLTASIRANT
jgi:uncharacterized protein